MEKRWVKGSFKILKADEEEILTSICMINFDFLFFFEKLFKIFSEICPFLFIFYEGIGVFTVNDLKLSYIFQSALYLAYVLCIEFI